MEGGASLQMVFLIKIICVLKSSSSPLIYVLWVVLMDNFLRSVFVFVFDIAFSLLWIWVILSEHLLFVLSFFYFDLVRCPLDFSGLPLDLCYWPLSS